MVLNRGRFSVNGLNENRTVANHYIKDLTINKSIEVFEAKAAACMFCFRIKVSFVNPSTKVSNQPAGNSIFSHANTVDWSETENFDSLLLSTAGAASIFAGK